MKRLTTYVCLSVWDLKWFCEDVCSMDKYIASHYCLYVRSEDNFNYEAPFNCFVAVTAIISNYFHCPRTSIEKSWIVNTTTENMTY